MYTEELIARILFELETYPDLPQIQFDGLKESERTWWMKRATRFMECMADHKYAFIRSYNPAEQLSPFEYNAETT